MTMNARTDIPTSERPAAVMASIAGLARPAHGGLVMRGAGAYRLGGSYPGT
jgi:hypothetical protein